MNNINIKKQNKTPHGPRFPYHTHITQSLLLMRWQWDLVTCPFVQQFLRCPFVGERMSFHPFQCAQNVRRRSRWFRNVWTTWIVSILIGHIRKLDTSTVGSIPMSRSLRYYTANTGFLGKNVIRCFILVGVRSIVVNLLRACEAIFYKKKTGKNCGSELE